MTATFRFSNSSFHPPDAGRGWVAPVSREGRCSMWWIIPVIVAFVIIWLACIGGGMADDKEGVRW